MFVSLPDYMLKFPIPNVTVLGGGTFGSKLGHEGIVLVYVISALIKRGKRDDLSFSHVRIHEKVAIYKPEGGPSSHDGPDSTLILDFITSRTVKNKCLLFNMAFFVTAAQDDKDKNGW